jgi:hypothetical protein
MRDATAGASPYSQVRIIALLGDLSLDETSGTRQSVARDDISAPRRRTDRGDRPGGCEMVLAWSRSIAAGLSGRSLRPIGMALAERLELADEVTEDARRVRVSGVIGVLRILKGIAMAGDFALHRPGFPDRRSDFPE